MKTWMETLQQPIVLAEVAEVAKQRLTRWARPLTGPRPTGSPQRRKRRRRASDTDADEVRVCGWFDSSHELNQGLVVLEVPETGIIEPWPQES